MCQEGKRISQLHETYKTQTVQYILLLYLQPTSKHVNLSCKQPTSALSSKLDASSELYSSVRQLSKSASMSTSSSPSPLLTTGLAPSCAMAACTLFPTAQKCSYCLLPKPNTPYDTPCMHMPEHQRCVMCFGSADTAVHQKRKKPKHCSLPRPNVPYDTPCIHVCKHCQCIMGIHFTSAGSPCCLDHIRHMTCPACMCQSFVDEESLCKLYSLTFESHMMCARSVSTNG